MDLFGIGSTIQGVANGISGILNYRSQKQANKINERYARMNADLQRDVAYNGLGIRIADAERNGISKWSVVGDGATAGQITSPNVEGAKLDLGGVFDSYMNYLSAKNLREQTQKVKQEKENLEYQKKYAEDHSLPIGIQPGLEQSILGWLDTPENRDMVANLFKNAYNELRGKIGNNPLADIENKVKSTVRHSEEAAQKRQEKRGLEKVRKLEQKAKKAAMEKHYEEVKEKRFHAQNRNSGALPPGSIPYGDPRFARKVGVKSALYCNI